jgi:hypothetical protein
MNCNDFIDSFSDYEDGLLPESGRVACEDHLAACTSCSRYVEVIQKGRSLLAMLPPVEVGEDFTPRLQHRIYHVADGDSLVREREAGSGTTAVTLLAMTVLLALAAWSPTVKRPLVVELPAIVVNEPPPRPVRLIYQSLPVNQQMGEPHLRNVWYGARDVLYRTSHISQRYSLSRAGLE